MDSNILNIGIWNIRGVMTTKLNELSEVVKERNINVMILTKTK